MSDETALDESQEGVGTPMVDSDDIQDEYELNDVEEGDYYATDDDEGQGAYAGDGEGVPYTEYAQGEYAQQQQYGEYGTGQANQ